MLETDKKIQVLHEHSEKFDVQAEGVFKYLQVRQGVWGSKGAGRRG